MAKQKSKQKGFTLLEVLVAVALVTTVSMVSGTVVFQTYMEEGRSSGRLTASQQVQNAGFWFKRDAAKAQTVMFDDPGTSAVTEFITLEWIDWSNTSYRVAYVMQDVGEGLSSLIRSYSTGGNTQTSFIADSISGSSANWTRPVLDMTLTAQVKGQTVTRTYQVKPRPIS